jgi:hypothetical protein
MESTDLIPLDGDVGKITRRAEEFKDLHEALQRNLQTYLPLTMDALAGVHQKTKSSLGPGDATRQMVCVSLQMDDNLLITCVVTGCPPKKVAVAHGVCGDTQIPYVTGRVLLPGTPRRGNSTVVVSVIYFESRGDYRAGQRRVDHPRQLFNRLSFTFTFLVP